MIMTYIVLPNIITKCVQKHVLNLNAKLLSLLFRSLYR